MMYKLVNTILLFFGILQLVDSSSREAPLKDEAFKIDIESNNRYSSQGH